MAQQLTWIEISRAVTLPEKEYSQRYVDQQRGELCGSFGNDTEKQVP
jgi:hypothetical protein